MTASKKKSTVSPKSSSKKKNNPTNDSVIRVAPVPSPEVSLLPSIPVPSAAAVASPATVVAPITPPGDLPPTVGVPVPPQGWVPTPKKKRSAKGRRPKGVQITSAQAVAKEITQSPTYVADFGSRAPAAGQVAFVVTNAAKWRDAWQAAKRFFAYASQQRAAWENDAIAQMVALKPAFEYAASRDSAVSEKYSATAKYLGETNAIAARGVAVRKAKGTKAGKGVTSAPPAASPEPIAPAVAALPAK